MLRELLSSRLIQGGLVFFLLCVGGSLLYSWHTLRTTEPEFGKRPQAVSPLENKQATSTAPSTGQATSIESTVLGKQDSDTVKATNTVQDQTQNRTDTPQDKSLEEASVSEIEAEIIAEEEKAEEALSAEKLRRQELKRRQKALYAEFDELIKSEGGSITPDNLPAAREATRILKDIADIQQEIEGVPNTALNQFVTLAQLWNDATNDKGEATTAGYAKLADYFETILGVEVANDMRALVKVAVDDGSETIKPEHLKLFFGK